MITADDLQPYPIGGVTLNTPIGHYLDMGVDAAQIVAVGAFQGEHAYKDTLSSGWELVKIAPMPTPDPENKRDFTRIIFIRVEK